MSGNFVLGISDHLAQFDTLDSKNSRSQNSQPNFYKDWKHFESEKFRRDFCSIN